jgi:hypothetical protein
MMMRDCNRELYTHQDGMTDDRMNARQEEKEKGNERVRERDREKEVLLFFARDCMSRKTDDCVCMCVCDNCTFSSLLHTRSFHLIRLRHTNEDV